MKAIVKHLHHHAFLAKSDSNHWLPLDNASEAGGPAAANNPVQLLLEASCGCVGIDTIDILRKKQIEYSDFQIEAEAIRFETAPKVFRSIEFHASMKATDLQNAAQGLKRAIDLSLTKYCTVSLSLDRSVKFTARCTVVGADGKILTIDRWEIPRDPAIYSRES